jgi:AcrR family transcriptional regulator
LRACALRAIALTVAQMSPAKRSLREPTRSEQPSTLDRIRDAARKIFYENGFFPASVEQIAEAAGFSRATIYLHFRSKDELLFELMRQDLEFQLGQYAEMTRIKRPSRAALRRWLVAFRAAIDARRPSLNLFWAGASIDLDYVTSIEQHRDHAIAILGRRFAGFDLDALSGAARERQRVKCYMMIFLIEGVSVHFFEKPGSPNLPMGLDFVAQALLHFIEHGEVVTG